MTLSAIVTTGLVCLALPAHACGAQKPAGAKPPLYSEVREPAGTPLGTVIVVHGGGWTQTGEGEVRYIAGEAARITGYGWRTVNVDYRPGRLALRDVLAWFDWTRDTYDGPICVLGSSAGANLALLLAAKRPSVRCVIGHGAITDLLNVKGTKKQRTLRRDYITPSFGRSDAELRRMSPIDVPVHADQRVLLATSAGDPWAPCAHQLVPYTRRVRGVRAHCLRAGAAMFVHAGVSPAALATEHRRERALLRDVARD